MLNKIRRLLTILNILNGERSLTNVLGQFDRITNKLSDSINQMYEEKFSRHAEIDGLREKMDGLRDRNDVTSAKIRQARAVRLRIEKLVSGPEQTDLGL